MRRSVGAIAVAAILSASASALANGRYPTASQIIVDPNDPQHLVVSATFGFLDSRDGGRSFNWLCEAAVGPTGENGFDIVLAVTGSGNTVLGLFDGMATTRDGCSFRIAPELAGQTIGDLTWRRSTPHQVVGYTIDNITGGFASQIVQSNDDGVTWTQLGQPLPSSLLPLTIDLAPSDPMRIYVSARGDKTTDFRSVLLRSDDGGATFQSIDIPGTEQQRLAYIAAVHPTDAERVYLRVLDDNEGVVFTFIYMTTDGGRTYQKIFSGTAELFGFAISPDGSQIAFGGPGDGLYVGASDGSNLARRSDVQPTALTWTGAGLYATADSKLAGFSVGRSLDSGASFEGLFQYQSMCGQTACGSVATAKCETQWELIAPQLGVTCSSPDAGSADAGPDAKPGGSGADAATTSGGASSIDSAGGCTVARTRFASNAWKWLVGGAVALRWRRRRRIAERSASP